MVFLLDYTNKNKAVHQFYTAILSIENEEQCQTFFEDIFTKNEIHSFAQRFEVARLLRAGETYQKIESLTGASTATISRVKRVLSDGKGGLLEILENTEK